MQPINFSTTKKLFKKYQLKYSSLFSTQQKELFDEMFNKLQDLDELSIEIVDLINNLLPIEDLSPDKNDVVTFGPFRIQIPRANPNIPIRFDNYTKPYVRSNSYELSTEKHRKLERSMERASVQCYQLANRIFHITKKLPNLGSYECKVVWEIRNYLIEHPEGEDSGITYDTFSYSKNEGPFIKGLRKGEQVEHMDKGFKNNFEEFTFSLNKALKLAINDDSEEIKV